MTLTWLGVAKPYMYVISDFTQNIVDFCKSHKRMQEHINRGVVDFALFGISLLFFRSRL